MSNVTCQWKCPVDGWKDYGQLDLLPFIGEGKVRDVCYLFAVSDGIKKPEVVMKVDGEYITNNPGLLPAYRKKGAKITTFMDMLKSGGRVLDHSWADFAGGVA